MSWWNEGPLSQFRENHPGLVKGASVGGLPGAAAGALYDWGASRGWWGSTNQQIQSQPQVNEMQGRTNQATQDAIWGNPSSGAPSAAPQADAPTSDAPAQDLGASTDDGPRDHAEIMQDVDDARNSTPALYGVSNFMVGGAPVINGVRPAGYDPNQGAMKRRDVGN